MDSNGGLSRRDFVKAAIAIGGSNAVAACLELETLSNDAGTEFPQGYADPSELPTRQHAWGNYIVRDAHGNTLLPQHQVLLFLDYTGSIPPTQEQRKTVEAAFDSLERAYQLGTGGDIGAAINRGLIPMISYSREYFDRFDTDLPADIDLPQPEKVLEAVGEDPAKANPADALLLLTADFGSILLSAEEGLFGTRSSVNGVEMAADLTSVFEVRERRTGVAGKGLPAENHDGEAIPESAPLSMGFKSGFRDNLPSEDKVTITGGPFDQGTTQSVSRLRINLGDWYDNDVGLLKELMFSPEHSHNAIGETGEGLGGHSGVTADMTENIESHGEKYGRMGHTVKTATARDDEFEPRILRRSEGVATDVVRAGVTGFNFTAIHQGVQDFIDTRKAMNPDEYDVDVEEPHHGIIDYLETRSRSTFLVPPRSLRALPSPTPNV